MILKIFSVYDSSVNAYLSPFFCRTKGEAIRALVNELDNPNSNIAKYPDDFILFEIGEYDDQSGSISSIAPVSVGVAIEFKNSDK